VKPRIVIAFLAAALTATTALAAPDNRDTVHNTFGNTVVDSFGKCVHTRWASTTDECAPQAPKRVALSQEERTVYFDFNKATLDSEAIGKLNTLATALKSDKQVRQARIAGYADRIGKPAYNEKLSKKRAETVRRYLVSRGFINGRVADTRWYGESMPATNCPDTLTRPELIACLRHDRKVQVDIDYLPTRSSTPNP
jgi:outer membrane protein OmpA-like peptidoglycan-associated protein